MTTEQAKKLKTMLDRYENVRGNDVLREKILISILGFVDGYVAGVLDQCE